MLTQTILSLGIGYLFGCIQSAYLLGRWVGKIDIREHGSGNAGASNITSTLGVKFGVIVGLVDILKGFFAVQVIKWIYPANPELAYLAGMMAILGHIFPFYLRFRGGKGVATLVGMMFGVSWQLGILTLLIVAVPAILTDYIVAGSFSSFIALPIITYFQGYSTLYILFGVALTGLCFYLHRENIKRIRAGEELKIRAVVFKKETG
jgi:glycerol-3-phosphate acyltransferase PlsY